MSFFRQCQQLPLWTRRARMGNQIRKLCRGNVASGSACRTSLGRLPLQPTKSHLCPRRWCSAASTFVWSLCSSQMACSSPHGSNRRLSRKFHFCKRHWKSPQWQQYIRTFSLLPPSSLAPCLHIATLIVYARHKACSYLPRTVYWKGIGDLGWQWS